MGYLFKFNLQYYLRLRQTVLALGLVVLFAVGLYFIMPVQGIGNLPAQNAQNANQIHAALDQYNQRILATKQAKATFHQYVEQEQLTAQLNYMDSFGRKGREYNQTVLALARKQQQTLQQANTKIISIGLPNQVTLQRNIALSQALIQQAVMRDKYARTGINYLTYLLQYLGTGLFAIFMLVVVALPSRRPAHFMVEGNYPVTAGQQRVNAVLVVCGLTIITVGISLGLGFMMASAFGGQGQLDYPQMLWQGRGFVAVSLSNFLLRWFSLMILVFGSITLINYVIAWFTHNELLALIIQLLLWGITSVLPVNVARFLPMHYYDYAAVLDGSNGAGYWQAILMLVIASAVLSGVMLLTQRGTQND